MIGQTLSHYKILEKLGEGGMGVVYKAQDTKLNRTVALKFLSPRLLADAQEKIRFLREAQAAAALNHPHICTIHEIDEADGRTFMVMEHIEGKNLRERIESGPMEIDEALETVIQVARGLSKAHGQGIVHRDIKPGNVLLTGDGQVKVVDFGLAKLAAQTRLTKTGGAMGTVMYMSPEQMKGDEVDHRSDIWSLGVMLYELLVGRLPFRGEIEHAVIYSILNEEPEPITTARRELPLELETLVEKALAKTPEKRYQQMDEMLADLEIQREELASGTKPKRSTKLRALRRKRWIRYAAVAGSLAILMAAGMQFTGGRSMAIHSIAVLPLENLSGDPEQEYFADGMTEALIADLAQIGALRVISRTSVMQYKGSEQDMSLPEIARQLGVDAIVEGSVFRDGDRVRITAQLIHAQTDRHLWADHYDREFVDILTLHSEVAQAIARQVKVRLTPEEETRLADTRPVDPEAYEAYLRGRAFMEKWFLTEDFEKSFEYLGRAIEKDPTYAPAYATLAFAYCEAAFAYLDRSTAYQKAKEAVTPALELDDGLAEAHAALGRIKTVFEWDWDGAEQAYQRALELDPNSATAHRNYAAHLIFVGRFDAGLKEFERVLELDPISVALHGYLAWGYDMARRYDEAIAQCKKTLELLEQFPDPTVMHFVHVQLVWSYIGSGMYEEALAEIEKWVPNSTWMRVWLYVEWGRRDEVDEMIEEPFAVPEASADVAAMLGDKDLAFQGLEALYEERSVSMLFLKVHPVYDNLRSDPRYEDLMRRMNFPE